MDEPNSEQLNSSDAPSIPVKENQREIAGFWQRLQAFIIDALLLAVVGILCGSFLFDTLANLGGWGRLVGFSVALLYFGLLNSSLGKGQTVGKRLTQIEVVDRSGQHISLWRSLLRFVILGTPYFLNGVLLPPSVIMSPIGHVTGFILFGFGGAIIYLYIFNRHTRQSLHDLIVGTFVTRTSPSGYVVGSVWRTHIVIVGIWLLVVALLVVKTCLSQQGVSTEILDVQRAIQASAKVHVATVNIGNSWRIVDGSRQETSFLNSNAVWKKRPKDKKSEALYIASIILSNYPEILKKDLLIVNVTYGYDIGISSSWEWQTFSHSPIEWQKLVAENSKK